MVTHAKAKQSRILHANANSHLSLVYWLGALLGQIQERINKTKTKIVCSERVDRLCADSRAEVCGLTYAELLRA